MDVEAETTTNLLPFSSGCYSWTDRQTGVLPMTWTFKWCEPCQHKAVNKTKTRKRNLYRASYSGTTDYTLGLIVTSQIAFLHLVTTQLISLHDQQLASAAYLAQRSPSVKDNQNADMLFKYSEQIARSTILPWFYLPTLIHSVFQSLLVSQCRSLALHPLSSFSLSIWRDV